MENQKIIVGRNAVFEYLRSARELSGELLVSGSAHGKIIDTIIGEAKKRGIRIQHVDKDELSQLHPSSNHQGVILRMSGGVKTMDARGLLELCAEKKGVLVLLDQLTDPHNIGAIIRSAEALGACGVVIPKAHAPDMGATIAKTSAGAIAHIPVVIASNAAQFMEEAKQAELWVIGSDDSGTTPLGKLSTLRPALLVIGSEGTGMRRLTAEKCDYVVKIPLKGKISSLNASVAAGILLYELLK
ncbi:MAG TPA: 23S rRNA (guanosine(2251)-2'-O)-methyltransferase RlmB [Spirochaetota bacterium]